MVNYGKTSIYKICCKDTTIKDIYIGSSCNFNRRKSQHKYDCNTENSKIYNLKVYKFIRDNGGWNNWNMIQIKEFSCENKREKEAEERKHIEELNPTLNCIIPTRSQKEYYIDNIETIKKNQKEYQIENKEKIIKQKKDYRLNNKEKIKECLKIYNLKNKEKVKEKNKEYYIDNIETIKKKHKEYRLENKEKQKEYQKDYRLNNKEKLKKYKKEYYLKNKEKHNKQMKEYREKNKK